VREFGIPQPQMDMIVAIKTMNLTFQLPDDSIAGEVTPFALFDD